MSNIEIGIILGFLLLILIIQSAHLSVFLQYKRDIKEIKTAAKSDPSDVDSPNCKCDPGSCVKESNHYKFCRHSRVIVDPEYLRG